MHDDTTRTKSRFDLLATCCLLGATLCWGTVPVILKYLSQPGYIPDGFTTNLVRYPVAALLYLPFLVYGARRGQLKKLWIAALLPSAINIFMQTLWAWAPYYLDASLLTFLMRLSVIWSIAVAFIVFRDERKLARSSLFWLGTVLAMGGFAVMCYQGLAGSGASKLGILIMFAYGVLFALYGVSVRYVLGNLNPLVLFGCVSLYTSIGLIGLAPLGNPSALAELPTGAMFLLVLSAVTGIAMAHGLYYIAVQRLGAAICSIMLMLTPFVAFLGAHLALGESLTTAQWAGGLVLILGSALASTAQSYLHNRSETPSATEQPRP